MPNIIEGNIRPLFDVGVTGATTAFAEQIIGRRKRRELRIDVDETLKDPRFSSGKDGKIHRKFLKKLDQSTPRKIGALSLYSAFSQQSYGEIAKSEGLECFYLFWGLGEEQDDLIDAPRKQDDQRPIAEIMSKGHNGDDEGFLKGTIHLIETKIAQGKMGEKEKLYLKGKIEDWHRFLSDQEHQVRSRDFSSFDFSYCRKYREDQNQKAGEVLVALLNWDKCLDPNFQKLEAVIPKFSILTQIVDDIADTAEDIEAQRPSFAVGALRENPEEFGRFSAEVRKRGIKKVHPLLFREFAPKSYRLLREQFRQYCLSSETQSGIKARGFNHVANLVFLLWPSFRDFLYRLSPEIANF